MARLLLLIGAAVAGFFAGRSAAQNRSPASEKGVSGRAAGAASSAWGEIVLHDSAGGAIRRKTEAMKGRPGRPIGWMVRNENLDATKTVSLGEWQPYDPLDRDPRETVHPADTRFLNAVVRNDALRPGEDRCEFFYRIVVDGRPQDDPVVIIDREG